MSDEQPKLATVDEARAALRAYMEDQPPGAEDMVGQTVMVQSVEYMGRACRRYPNVEQPALRFSVGLQTAMAMIAVAIENFDAAVAPVHPNLARELTMEWIDRSVTAIVLERAADIEPRK